MSERRVTAADQSFVGRQDVLAAILDQAHRAASGQPRVVWIEGAAGQGKSAVIQETISRLPDDYSVVRAECDEMTAEVPFGLTEDLGAIRVDGAFAVGMQLLGIFSNPQHPQVILVEDFHWADEQSRIALLTTVRRMRRDRVLVLITSRPEPVHHDGWERFCRDRTHCLRVDLGAFTVDDVQQFASTRGTTLTSAAAIRLWEHTQGHPLYVSTLMAELTADQLVESEGGLPAPRSLASTTVARLAQLPSDGLALAAAMAILGDTTRLATAAKVADVDAPTEALERLLETGFVRWIPAGVDTTVSFTHPLFRVSLLADLSPLRRQALHRRAAQVVDPAASLAHRVAAADGSDDALSAELAAAGAIEYSEQDPKMVALAIRNLSWAATLCSRPEHARQLWLQVHRLNLAAGNSRRVIESRDHIEGFTDSPLKSWVLGTVCWELGDAAGAERWFSHALQDPQIPEDAVNSELRAAALAALGTVFSTTGRGREAESVGRQALQLSPTDPDIERTSWIALAVGVAHQSGAAAALAVLHERLPQSAGLVSAPDTDVLIARGTLNFFAGRSTAGVADLERAIRLLQHGRRSGLLPRAHAQLANLFFLTGAWDDALLHARVALSLISEERQVWITAQVHACFARLLGSRGQFVQATEHLAAAAESAASIGNTESVFTTRIAQATIARAQQDSAGVIAALGPLTVRPAALPMATSMGWWPMLISALIDRGDLEAAAGQLAELEAGAATRGQSLRAVILGLKAELAAGQGDLVLAATLGAQAVDETNSDTPVLDRAWLMHFHGRVLLQQGNNSAGLDQLRQTRQLLISLNARPFLDRLDADLAAADVRMVRSATAPHSALTEREHDVAALVAKGLTNREAAAELYVSEKTVEYHLGNVFGKLGITSRRQLRRQPVAGAP